jgi:hypothetical protein
LEKKRSKTSIAPGTLNQRVLGSSPSTTLADFFV